MSNENKMLEYLNENSLDEITVKKVESIEVQD